MHAVRFALAVSTSALISNSVLADTGRANMAVRAGAAGYTIELGVSAGSVIVREIGIPGSVTYSSGITLVLTEGEHQISAASSDAAFSIAWTEPMDFSDGDVTPHSFSGTEASFSFGTGGSEDETLQFGTGASSSSAVSFTLRAYGACEKSLIWVNDVSGDGTFTMPAEASDKILTAFADGDHTITMNPSSIMMIGLGSNDGGGDGDGGGDDGGDGDGDGDGLFFAQVDASSFSLVSVFAGADVTRTLSVDLGGSSGAGLADINGDCIVDGADLGMLLGAWGTSCP